MTGTRRFYRERLTEKGLYYFRVVVKETDLWIGILPQRFTPDLAFRVEKLVQDKRAQLEEYIASHSDFAAALSPIPDDQHMPEIARRMARAASIAGVGPMAAVAGAFSDLVGRELQRYSRDVMVENGGDIYLKRGCNSVIGIYAADSPFSGSIGIEVAPNMTPLGICTSSGTVGHSLSFGKADAAIVLAESATLADAVATATANKVQQPGDVQAAADFAGSITGVLGTVVICKDKLAAWGKIRLCRLE